jgi:hypothetical protein
MPVLIALILLGAAITVRSFAMVVSSTSTRESIVAATSGPAADAPVATMKIAPAPVIDPGAERFVGTGDGSEGGWVRP